MPLCISCTVGDEEVDFPTVKELIEHQKGGHQTRPKKELPPSKPVTPSATELKAMEEKLANPKNVPIKYESISVVSAKQIPLELKYVWTGVHALCGSEPKTIEVDLSEERVAVLAFCFSCNEKLSQQEVLKISSQQVDKQFPIKKKK